MKKGLKIILIIAAIIIGLLTIVMLLVSPVAKSYVNHHGKDLIGREIKVEKLKVNALFGRVRIYDMTVYEEDDQTAFFSMDTLDVSVKLRKLLWHKLHVRHIVLAEPRVRILQDGDRFNFSSIIDHFASDEEEEEDTTASDWKLGFYNIRLSNGEVFYADKKMKSKWDLKHLNIKIPGVYFDGEENTDAGVALQLADGGVLRTDASLNMDNNNFAVNVELEKFAISNAKAYLSDVMNVGKMEGLLDAGIKVNGNLSDILDMNIKGTVNLGGVDIRDNRDDQVLTCSSLAVAVNRINLKNNVYDIEKVSIDGLTSQYNVYADGSNFSRLFDVNSQSADTEEQDNSFEESQPTTDVTEEASSSTPLSLRVGSFAVNDAQFTYNDYSLPDQFSFPLKKINIKADNISSGGDNNARVMAQLPHSGMAMIRWHGNINDWKQSQHLVVNIKNLQLKDLSPYSVAYLGFPFEDGTLSFTSDNSIRYSQLDGKNMLDLYNPELGEKRKDVDAKVNIPLKAALYILKDKDGKIQLDVPVKGNIDSPEFSYMKIVWKTLGNLVVKVATSPFRAVAKTMGKDGELDFITFNPLQTHFNSEQYSTLNKIADVLQYDTNIVVTLVPQYDGELVWKQQSLYLLKEEYYMTRHPERASSKVIPQTFLFDEVSSISAKDTGFVAFVRTKGIASKRPSDKEIQRLAERCYPKDAALSSLEILAGFRDDYVRRFYSDQGINENRLQIGPLQSDSKRSGYGIESDVRGGTVEEE